MADLFSPVKRVQIKVGEYLAREKKKKKAEEERQSKIEGLRRYERKLRRDKRDAEIARRRAARRADEVSSEADMEVSRIVTEVEATPVFEDEIDKRPQSGQDSGSETRTVRILPTGEDDYDYWSDAGLYSPGTPQPAQDE